MPTDLKHNFIVLTELERSYILGTSVEGSGGLQSFQRWLQVELANSLTLELDDANYGRLIRYATRYGTGGFQNRLRNAFGRHFRKLLDSLPQEGLDL